MRRLNLGLLLFVATMSTSACSECNYLVETPNGSQCPPTWRNAILEA